ncbi:MAG TPA: hypothetical protein VMD25_04130 [Acidobacteriaceae bacterium]|nr:hypothetical protein [Acidobacteriaceae bacterium]
MKTPPPPVPKPRAGPAEDAVQDVERQLLLEISKSLLSGSLANTRGAVQMLQALSGLLLTSYTTLLIAFGQRLRAGALHPIVLGLPILFYTISLLISFGQVFFYRGARFSLGDLPEGFEAYERVVAAQRRQLIWPLVFLIAGLAAVTVVIVEVLRLR